MHRIVTRFRLIVIVAVLAAANIVAQQAPSNAGPHLQPNAGGEEAAVKRIVDGIMQPYLSQGQRDAGGRRWSRSSHLGAIVAVSLHGHHYFFPYAKATDAGAPFTRETLVEIGSCTKTFTNTLLALGINRHQIVADAPAQKDMPNGYTLRAQQLDTTGVGGLHLGNAGRSDQPAAWARTAKHRRLPGERLSYLGFELRTQDPIACAL